MAFFQLVVKGFGLAGLKPAVYRAGFGSGLDVGDSGDFPTQVVEDVASMTGEGAGRTAHSFLGLPVFADVRFPASADNPLIVLQTVLVEVAMQKTIVKTAVQGRRGTVKEYVSDGDYEVRLRGALVSAGSSAFPHGDMKDLQELLARRTSVEVVSDYLRLFGIYNLVITGYRFPQSEGMQNTQLFEIEAVSDLPDELVSEDEL